CDVARFSSAPGRASHVAKGIRVLSSKTVYDGRVVRLRIDRVIEPGNVEATREVVCHRGSVVVLPLLDDGRVLLVRQFRYATGKARLELVTGGIELAADSGQSRPASTECKRCPATYLAPAFVRLSTATRRPLRALTAFVLTPLAANVSHNVLTSEDEEICLV